MKRLLRNVGAAICVIATSGLAQPAKPRPVILAGLREVQVGVAESGCVKAGLDTNGVRVQAVAALKKAGLRIAPSASTEFHLSFACEAVPYADGTTAINVLSILGGLREWVTPTRTGAKTYFVATTWQFGWSGHVPGGEPLTPQAIDHMREVLSGFEHEWLAANPRRN